MSEPYADPRAAMLDQLRRVRLWLARYGVLHAERNLHPDPSVSHHFVSDAEFLDTIAGSVASRAKSAELEQIKGALVSLEEEIGGRVETTLMAGGSVPLWELASVFHLGQSEQDVLLALVAPQIDMRLGRAYTNAWEDFQLRQPSVGFVMDLVSGSWSEQQDLRAVFEADATLTRCGLIDIHDGQKWLPATPLLYQLLSVPRKIVDFLLNGDQARIALEIADFVDHYPSPTEAALLIPISVAERLGRILSRPAPEKSGNKLVALMGPKGCGKKTLARRMASALGQGIVVLDALRAFIEEEALVRAIQLAMREARLRHADLYLDNIVDLTAKMDGPTTMRVVEQLRAYPGVIYLGGEDVPSWAVEIPGIYTVMVPYPTAETQESLWRRHLAGRGAFEPGFDVAQIVSNYSLSGGAIEKAADAAFVASRVEQGNRGHVILTKHEVFAAAQHQLSHRLGLLAEKVTRTLSWDDLVLPDQTFDALWEMIGQFRHQNIVFNEWGFSAKVTYGRGLSALFHGPPGTGKTMVAGVIARELGLELYKIDLSRVVDKYIGETEKNLGRIFDEAARSQAILLFDEADSLFSKRTQVKSSHDRYANLETNYLLQRMEAFEGVCLLTTNFEAGLDDAFKRRLRFKITFPRPSVVERERLWRSMMPPEADVSEDVDYRRLAEEFDLTGGNIKNTVLRAAFVAARTKRNISHEVLFDAALDEYREMGKLVRG